MDLCFVNGVKDCTFREEIILPMAKTVINL